MWFGAHEHHHSAAELKSWCQIFKKACVFEGHIHHISVFAWVSGYVAAVVVVSSYELW